MHNSMYEFLWKTLKVSPALKLQNIERIRLNPNVKTSLVVELN